MTQLKANKNTKELWEELDAAGRDLGLIKLGNEMYVKAAAGKKTMDIRKQPQLFDLWLGKLVVVARAFNSKFGSEYVIVRITEKLLISNVSEY